MRQQRQLDRWQEGWGGSSSKEQESRVMDGEERGSTRGEGARCASREGEEAEEAEEQRRHWLVGRSERSNERTLFSPLKTSILWAVSSSVMRCR